jgi:hypothetical protein
MSELFQASFPKRTYQARKRSRDNNPNDMSVAGLTTHIAN